MDEQDWETMPAAMLRRRAEVRAQLDAHAAAEHGALGMMGDCLECHRLMVLWDERHLRVVVMQKGARNG